MKKTFLSYTLLLGAVAGSSSAQTQVAAAPDQCPCCAAASPESHNQSTVTHETEANIIGHVLDAESKQHLAGVVVSIVGTPITTHTDKTGHYFFKDIPVGTHQLRFSAVGYDTTERSITIRPNESITLDIEITPTSQQLADIVVSATRNATKRRLAPIMVNVMDATLFERTQSNDLAQALKFQPGVRVENNCQNCGFSQVRINGLDGKYSQILIDSRPVFSALAGIYGLEQLPTNMVERVEVVRGGGSALYGSSAVGGIINVITKEPLAPSASFSHQIRGIGGLSAFENHSTFNATYVTDNNQLGITLFGQNRHRAGYDRDGDGFTETPKLDGRSIGMHAFAKISPQAKITAELHAADEYRRGGDRLDDAPHNAEVAEQLEHTNLMGSLNYTQFFGEDKHKLQVYASLADVKRRSYYGGGETASALMATIADPATNASDLQSARKDLNGRLASYGNTKGLTGIFGAQYAYDFDRLLFMPSQITVGAEQSFDHLKDISGYRTEWLKQRVATFSAFAQNEWRNEAWSLLIGARIDKHSLVKKAIVSPRASLRFNPNRNLVLRANYASGFRAPQIFDEDLHVDNAGGDLFTIVNSKNLHEERSKSYSASADWYGKLGAWDLNLTAEGFYTRLTDAFALADGENIVVKGVDVAQKLRFNSSGARVVGANFEGRIAYKKFFSLQAGWTLQSSKYDEAQLSGAEGDTYRTRRFLRTPNSYGYFLAQISPAKHFDIAINGSFTGEMLAAHNIVTNDDGTLARDAKGVPYSTVHTERLMMGSGQTASTAGGRTLKTPAFFEMGVKLQYTVPLYRYYDLQLFAGVNNVFDAFQDDLDRGRDRDSAYIYGPSAPRNFFAGFKLNF